MKAALVSLLFIAVVVFSASATLLPDCSRVTCNPDTCPDVNCACGSHKVFCGCCDMCDKCPEEQCNTYFLERCSSGYECVLDDPNTHFETGGVAHCKPKPATEEAHTS
ncbi:uncharacterized protein LOC144101116 [Amblyomma americanum]